MTAFVGLPALVAAEIADYLDRADLQALVATCKDIRASQWYEDIVLKSQLALPPTLQGARAALASMSQASRLELYTTFRLADMDLVPYLAQTCPQIRRLAIPTLTYKWRIATVKKKAITLSPPLLTPLVGTLLSLDLRESGVTDVTPLAALLNLEKLDLSDNHVATIEALGTLTKLRVLDVKATWIQEISCVASMPKLEYLDISTTKVCDIAPVCALSGLQTLKLHLTTVVDLTLLSATECNVTDSLRVLHLCDVYEDGDVAELLLRCTNLRSLALRNPSGEATAAAISLSSLEELDIQDPRLPQGNTAAFSPLVNLSVLRITSYEMTDLLSLRSLRQLKELKVDCDAVSTDSKTLFEPLRHLESLQVFEYRGGNGQITDYDHISCTRLTSLQIQACGDDKLPIQLFRRNPQLRTLEILQAFNRGVWKCDLRGLSELPQLQELRISANWAVPRADGLASLRALHNLRALFLSNVNFTDLKILSAMKKLVTLGISYSKITDLKPIQALVSLEELNLRYTIIPEITPLCTLPRLRKLRIPEDADCSPAAHGQFPSLVDLFHPTHNCLGIGTREYNLRRPVKRCRWL